MVISIIGPSGSGKGTQAQLLAEKFNLPNLSCGEILREEFEKGTPEGLKAEKFTSRGEWAPSPVLHAVLAHYLEDSKYQRGFILDGTPRTLDDVQFLDTFLAKRGQKVDWVLHLDTSDETSVARIMGRVRQAVQSGESIREDEQSAAAIRERIASYHETIAPILSEYEKRGILIRINNEPPIGEVFEDILARLPTSF